MKQKKFRKLWKDIKEVSDSGGRYNVGGIEFTVKEMGHGGDFVQLVLTAQIPPKQTAVWDGEPLYLGGDYWLHHGYVKADRTMEIPK